MCIRDRDRGISSIMYNQLKRYTNILFWFHLLLPRQYSLKVSIDDTVNSITKILCVNSPRGAIEQLKSVLYIVYLIYLCLMFFCVFIEFPLLVTVILYLLSFFRSSFYFSWFFIAFTLKSICDGWRSSIIPSTFASQVLNLYFSFSLYKRIWSIF